MRWPLGYVALDSVIETWAPERAIDLLASLGFEAVDWSFVQFDKLDQSPTGFRDLVKRSRDAGLQVPQLVLADDYITLDAGVWQRRVEHGMRAVDAAAEAGVATVGVNTGPHGWNKTALRVGVDLTESQAWDLAVAGVTRIVEHGQAADVRVGLESVWNSIADSGESTQRMLDAIPGLGITFDPSHLVLPGDDIPMWLHKWRDHIVHVHLKDAFGSRGKADKDFFFPLLGEGQVPWQSVLTTLNDDGYQGFACIEAESYALLTQCFQDDPTEPARISLMLAKGLYDLAGL
jgi:sugar phosphate isomerase/epimerase